MDNKKQWLFSTIITVIGPLLILLGGIRLVLYYFFFDINILNFLELGEIITSFFNSIILLVGAGTLGFFLIRFRNGSTAENRSIISPNDSFGTRLKKYCKRLWPLLTAGVATLLVLITINALIGPIGIELILGSILITVAPITLLIMMYEFNWYASNGRISDFDWKIGDNLFTFFLIGLLIVYLTLIEVRTVKRSKYYYGTQINLDNDEKFVSDSSTYFIGNTKNYLFIYSEETNSTRVLPMSRIKEIVFRKSSRFKGKK
ncbi:hypothetical protein [Paracnuella aquatica]|uniref:hypothetical protein n=1 Tax=Paracnuella aquatica TaxID=2268757 RepID=UPI000DEFF99D|nr:hypothetical protein [Paracnuella aquatica]RPD44428.1 hypothetical protein DRJ53_17070 [Paracnuella aquatica]